MEWDNLRYILAIARAKSMADAVLQLKVHQYNLTKQDADIAIRTTNNPPEHLVGRKITRAAIAIYGYKNSFPPITS